MPDASSSRPTLTGRVVGWLGIAIAVLFSCAIVWAAGRFASTRAIHAVQSEGRASAALHAALLRSELQKFRLLPFALTEDNDAARVLTAGSENGAIVFDRKLERLNGSIHAAAIYLIAANGRTLAASNWNKPLSFVGSNYDFRSYFRQAMRRGSFEQFALGTVSRIPGLYIARRISSSGEKGVIVLKVEFDQLETEWAQSGSPAFVTDSRGIVLITSVPEWRFLTTRTIAPAQRAELRRSLDFGDAPLTQLPIERLGAKELVSISSSAAVAEGRYAETVVPTATPGWHLHILTPIDGRVSAAANTARLSTAIVLLLAGLGLGAVNRRRRRRLIETRQAEDARTALEAEVDARTAELRKANRNLTAEMESRRASEEKLQTARDQLIQANKLASLGQISAGVAHEINQPVAAIRNYAENGRLLLAQARSEDAQANFDRIAAMTDRIGAITGELRGFARKAGAKLGPTPIDDAIEGALLLLRDRIERLEVTISREGDCGVSAMAERIRLEQVLMNVLGNALDALGQAERQAPRIAIDVRLGSETVTVDIGDNGPGLPASAAKNLFKPFTTSKDQGLGLGLIISRDIMRDMNGDLVLVPSVQGARFSLQLKPA